MADEGQVGRHVIVALVTSSLHQILAQKNQLPSSPVEESTHLTGDTAAVDSLGLITLVVDLEQRLENEHNIILVLTDDSPVSEGNDPFRTVESLTDHICFLIKRMHNMPTG